MLPKTDYINLNYGKLLFLPDTKEVKLNTVLDVANRHRLARNQPQVQMMNFTRSSVFIDMVIATEIKLRLRIPNDFSGKIPNIKHNGEIGNYKNIISPLVRTVRGHYSVSGSFVHPYIAFDAAVYLDKQLATDVYEAMLTSTFGEYYNTETQFYYGLIGSLTAPNEFQESLAFFNAVLEARVNPYLLKMVCLWTDMPAAQRRARNHIRDNINFLSANGKITSFQELLNTTASGVFPALIGLPTVDLELVRQSFLSKPVVGLGGLLL
jgi:hypothetical protein